MVYAKAIHPETKKPCELYLADIEVTGEANSGNITQALSKFLETKELIEGLL